MQSDNNKALVQHGWEDLNIDRHTRTFLKELNENTKVPPEQMAPKDARHVPVNAQAGVEVDLSGIIGNKKNITHQRSI